ncbi:S8 family serine peptidase [Dokdonia sp.]|uniref:S8 family serine peptidase n=1 Tax=Dokdonia sp. TaxID=2024995 RepID=UPI003266B5D8
MKKLTQNFKSITRGFLCIVAFLGATIHGISQEWTNNSSQLYYVTKQGKIYMEPDYSAAAIYFNENLSEEKADIIRNRLKSTNTEPESLGIEFMNFKGMVRLKSTVGLRPIRNLENRQNFLSSYGLTNDGAYDVLPAFTVGGIQAWMTKRIVIRLKEGYSLNSIAAIMDEFGAEYIKNITDANTFHIKVENIGNQLEMIHRINDLGILDWGEPDFKMELQRFNDPLYPDQWHLNNTGGTLDGKPLVNDVDIDAPEAWTLTTGNNVVVAVIDDGMDNHEDLTTLLTGYTPGVTSGDGSAGFPQYNNFSNPPAHGQACGGLIGATHNNIGVKGVSPDVSMFSVNIFHSSVTNADIAIGVDWAVNAGADVISNSWGFSCTVTISVITSAFNNAAENGRGGLGCLLIVAAGNSNLPCVSYPANLTSVMAVGAISGDGERSEFSQYGSALDIVGPSNDDLEYDANGFYVGSKHGLRTLDLMGSDGYEPGNYDPDFGGTSGATPIVAGVAALVLAIDPTLTKNEAEYILYSTAVDVGDSYEYGNGMVNAYDAVLAASSFTGGTINCTTTVSSYPYSEGFEFGDGWIQTTVDVGDWVRNSGVTPSTDTGPSGATEGSFYMFLEASTNSTTGAIGNNATARLQSNCFDLSGISNATFSFQNHMYGTSVGSLTVQVSVDDINWTNVWSQSGNQGNQWNSVDINLDAYIGSSIKLRIVGITGDGWSSDIAIDDLSMTTSGSVSDIEAPTTPTNLISSNIAETSFDISWNASSDNIGVTQYEVYLDGISDGLTTSTSYSFSGLTDNTTYSVTVLAKDAAGNESTQSNSLNITTLEDIGGCTDTTYDSDDFEGGFSSSIWNDGGTNARINSNDSSFANSGILCVRLRNGTSTSTITTDSMDLSSYEEITVTFSYITSNLENGEGFSLQSSTNGGSSFTIEDSWLLGSNFSNNGSRENGVVTISGPFSNTTQLKLQHSANRNNERTYFDDVIIEGCSSNETSSIIASSNVVNYNSNIELDYIMDDIMVYPNPVNQILNIDNLPIQSTMRLMNISGQLLMDASGKSQLDMSRFKTGVYILYIQAEGKTKVIKVVKQ